MVPQGIGTLLLWLSGPKPKLVWDQVWIMVPTCLTKDGCGPYKVNKQLGFVIQFCLLPKFCNISTLKQITVYQNNGFGCCHLARTLFFFGFGFGLVFGSSLILFTTLSFGFWKFQRTSSFHKRTSSSVWVLWSAFQKWELPNGGLGIVIITLTMFQIMKFEGTHMSEFICSSVLMFNKEIFTALLFTKFVSFLSLIILEFFYR